MKTHGALTYTPPAELGHGQAWRIGKWTVQAEPHVIIRVKRVFPRGEQARSGYLWFDDTLETCLELEWILQRWPLRMDSYARERLTRRAAEYREREEVVNEILTGKRPHLGAGLTEPIREPRDYQLVAADLALTTGSLLLTDELGLGKTMSGLLVLRDPSALPALVVCPTHLPAQWEHEIRITLPFLRTHIVRTLRAYDPAKRRGMNGYDPDVMIVPYSKLRGWGDHLAGKVNTVIFDEAQELRRANVSGDEQTKKYMAAAMVADGAQYRVGLTATPVYNYGGELHNILDIIAPDVLGGRYEFSREWCGGAYWSDKVAVDNPKALGAYLRDRGIMLRRTRKDVGRELPGVVRVPHTVDTDEAKIEQLTSNALDLADLILSSTATREDRFNASGLLEAQLRHATGVAKAPYVAEFVKMLLETDERVVLFGWHRDVYATWRRHLKDFDPVMYTGSESPKQKLEAKRKFVDGESRLLMMSLRSGAGLDGLQEIAHVCVFGELDWSPMMHEQCIGRLHRDGQDESVVAYFLVSDEGTDPVMAEVLQLKRMQSEPLIDPDRPAFEKKVDDRDRVRRLAEEVRARRRRGRPERKAVAA